MVRTSPSWPGTSTTPSRGAVGQIQGREAQLDGDAARLLLGEAIGVDAGQRPDQRGLAVVDVARGAENEPLRRFRLSAGQWRRGPCRAAGPRGWRPTSVGALVVLEQRNGQQRDMATAVPFSMWTSSFFFDPLRRKRVRRRRAW